MTAINEDLIRQYAEGASPDGIKNLLTLFDAFKRDRDRAEDLCRHAYKNLEEFQKRHTDSPSPREREAPASTGEASSERQLGRAESKTVPKVPKTDRAIDIEL